jgi:hypothetical protein
MPAMHRRDWLITLAVVAAALQSIPASAATLEGSGRAASETRTPGTFKAIRTTGSFDLVVRQGETTKVIVHGDDNLLSHLETVVESGTLSLRWKSGLSLRTRARTLVEIVTPTLAAYASSGSGDLELESFKTPALAISLSGSGDAQLAALQAEELRLRISGSGDVKGAGKGQRVEIAISGSGDVSFADFEADDVSVRIAGSGDAAVFAHKTLKVSIAGSGDVSYKGEAQVVSSVAGSGRVRKR